MGKITQKELKDILHFNPDTGEFRWLVSAGKRSAGDIAGCHNNEGYYRICISRKSYTAHRLAWLYIYGEFPPNCLDHINGIRDDNRIINLRLASRSENCWNTKVIGLGYSKYKGVSWHKKDKKWCAAIKKDRKTYFLGNFKLEEQAAAAYDWHATLKFGMFAKTNGDVILL